MKNRHETIVLGGGCFWCTEAVFWRLKGVLKTTPGYAGGFVTDPTYEIVCTGGTGHAEVIRVEYDPKIIGLQALLNVFFSMHDPTSLNQQGRDSGTQYRSIILCTSDEQMKISKKYVNSLQDKFDKPIVTEIKMLESFYPAEERHRNYYERNPHLPYCMLVIRPKIKKIEEKYKSLLEQ